MSKLRVSDIVKGFEKEDLEKLKDSMKILNDICDEYSDIESIISAHDLDELKRKFVGHFQFFSKMFSKVKRYKGASHTYLEEERKRIKAEAIENMLEGGDAKNITAAKELVYSFNYYVERIDLLQSLLEFFIKSENMYDYYLNTLQSIIQSISVASKERHVV
ncbi:MAG: hypothetical protein WD512_13130 [Candidatus Paceibacterota bacterium]